ncbi:hypothetical protein N9Y42_04120 [Mariniblastus sp.]|nr:hypothetical protein [Mariniblastus sp.]
MQTVNPLLGLPTFTQKTTDVFVHAKTGSDGSPHYGTKRLAGFGGTR